MIFLKQHEKIELRMAIGSVIMGGIVQPVIFGYMIKDLAILFVAIDIPLLSLFIFLLPSLICMRLTATLVYGDKTHEETNRLFEDYLESIPMLFWIPIFQMHGGLLYIIRTAYAVIVRIIRKEHLLGLDESGWTQFSNNNECIITK